MFNFIAVVIPTKLLRSAGCMKWIYETSPKYGVSERRWTEEVGSTLSRSSLAGSTVDVRAFVITVITNWVPVTHMSRYLFHRPTGNFDSNFRLIVRSLILWSSRAMIHRTELNVLGFSWNPWILWADSLRSTHNLFSLIGFPLFVDAPHWLGPVVCWNSK